MTIEEADKIIGDTVPPEATFSIEMSSWSIPPLRRRDIEWTVDIDFPDRSYHHSHPTLEGAVQAALAKIAART